MIDDDNNDTGNNIQWKEAILSVLEGENKKGKAITSTKNDDDENQQLKVKKLRKLVLLSLQLDEDDKKARKSFKRTIQSLEEEGGVQLDSDGRITLLKKRKRKDEKNDKKKKKKKEKRAEVDTDDQATGQDEAAPNHHQQHPSEINSSSSSSQVVKDKNAPCKGNPQGVTRLFLGNLPFAVDETSLEAYIPGMTHVKWITDKETGKFYGSAFVEMDTAVSAASAVAKAGTELMGRPVKINFAPALPGDKWPPEKKVVTGGGAASSSNSNADGTTGTKKTAAGGMGISAMSTKPENCVKLFIGNLSYDIDDDGITKFFASVDAEVKAVRWLHHKDTGDFKGVGFVEFWNTEACDRAAALNGKNLLGRPIRIDWTD